MAPRRHVSSPQGSPLCAYGVPRRPHRNFQMSPPPPQEMEVSHQKRPTASPKELSPERRLPAVASWESRRGALLEGAGPIPMEDEGAPAANQLSRDMGVAVPADGHVADAQDSACAMEEDDLAAAEVLLRQMSLDECSLHSALTELVSALGRQSDPSAWTTQPPPPSTTFEGAPGLQPDSLPWAISTTAVQPELEAAGVADTGSVDTQGWDQTRGDIIEPGGGDFQPHRHDLAGNEEDHHRQPVAPSPIRRRVRRALEGGGALYGETLFTIDEGEVVEGDDFRRRSLHARSGSMDLDPQSSQAPHGGGGGGGPGASRFMGSPFPSSSRSEPGHLLSQERLSPSQPLASQLSPSLAALLSVLSTESDYERQSAHGGITGYVRQGSLGGASRGHHQATTAQQVPLGDFNPYRELDISPSLSALLAILAVDTDPESPDASSGPRLQTSRTLQPVRSGLEASLRELDMDSSPVRLQRQASLDSGLQFYRNNEGIFDPSPTGSLHSSPCCSPARTTNSSLQSTPSPVLTRRMTGNRNSVVLDCWQAGPMRQTQAMGGGSGLRSVTEILETEGTAAFYRGFKADASPVRPSSKRTKIDH